MTDLPPDHLRDALRQAGQTWAPARPPAEARARVLAGLDRRRRQRHGVLVTACLAVVLGLLVAPMFVARDDGRRLFVQGSALGPPTSAGGSGFSGAPGDLSTGDGAPRGPTGSAHGPDAPGAKAPPIPSTGRPAGASSTSTSTTIVGHLEVPGAIAPPSTPVETSEPIVITADSGIAGTVRISPVCPVERDPPDPACAPRPARADIRVLRNGALVASGQAGDDGAFRIDVRPGRYVVEATRGGPAIGSGCQTEPGEIQVVAGARATVTVVCDTGIR